MSRWPDSRLTDLLGIDLPIVQAPMAGVAFADMAAAVSRAGGLGSLACAMLSAGQVRSEVAAIRQQGCLPLNLNFFCHQMPAAGERADGAWRARLAGYYREYGLDPAHAGGGPSRAPFDATACELVEELRPSAVSFHFGLPAPALLARVKASGAVVLASATTVAEARWLETHGCDVVIAQGAEAGGHRGMFLSTDVHTQVGSMALLPRVVDAVRVPVLAAGGIGDARGLAAAFALGAAGVQLGSAYLLCPEARIAALHRKALLASEDDSLITNVFSGRPARSIGNRLTREVGPLSTEAPAFPLAGGALAALRSAAGAAGSDGFMSLWAGQAVSLARELPAGELTRRLAEETLARLGASS
jgi:nitronate monooxygenase